MTPDEISKIDWRECSMNVLCKVGTIFINSGNFGAVCSPEAIMIKQEATNPFEAFDSSDEEMSN